MSRNGTHHQIACLRPQAALPSCPGGRSVGPLNKKTHFLAAPLEPATGRRQQNGRTYHCLRVRGAAASTGVPD
jgi:hypothetical protein